MILRFLPTAIKNVGIHFQHVQVTKSCTCKKHLLVPEVTYITILQQSPGSGLLHDHHKSMSQCISLSGTISFIAQDMGTISWHYSCHLIVIAFNSHHWHQFDCSENANRLQNDPTFQYQIMGLFALLILLKEKLFNFLTASSDFMM